MGGLEKSESRKGMKQQADIHHRRCEAQIRKSDSSYSMGLGQCASSASCLSLNIMWLGFKLANSKGQRERRQLSEHILWPKG